MTIYLDHNATSPLRPQALEALLAASSRAGNPSSLHRAGQDARRQIDAVSRSLLSILGAPSASKLVFTASGTEANALGVASLFGAAGVPESLTVWGASLEHPAVAEALEACRHRGAKFRPLPVDGRTGEVDVARLPPPDKVPPGIVAMMLANNESGVIQPVKRIALWARSAGLAVHCDAVQAVGKIPVDMGDLGVDTLALAGHKFGGPKGVGAVIAAPGIEFSPLWGGGGQQRGARSGTLPTPLIAAMGAALEAEADLERLRPLTERLAQALTTLGFDKLTDARALPQTLAVTPRMGQSASGLARNLAEAGVAVGTGSACHSAASPNEDHEDETETKAAQLRSLPSVPRFGGIKLDGDPERGALRFSLGWNSTGQEVDGAIAALNSMTESDS